MPLTGDQMDSVSEEEEVIYQIVDSRKQQTGITEKAVHQRKTDKARVGKDRHGDEDPLLRLLHGQLSHHDPEHHKRTQEVCTGCTAYCEDRSEHLPGIFILTGCKDGKREHRTKEDLRHRTLRPLVYHASLTEHEADKDSYRHLK